MSELSKTHTHPAHIDASGCASSQRGLCFRLSAALQRWYQRRRLLRLDERMLRDIGLSRCDAEREAAKRWRK
ncbi:MULTISPECIES: DUF1127 domain-containing protein [Filomicrobium]|uniref:Uncharacterized conserved protein YjiS, DUF1127 family n=1 Tax=Filomicrobium insigne TaxID=418854 RepID=A0A1H0PUR7_9HYPH|nr:MULTISPECIES: DUF1127 domain-containing protein [Filomicrobium]MCV0369869.1 DUF1127 domain-containing protein [Filomicrobium sp.]SDP08897.1 Uncharacterized conserved protein YjiS, DUF1127 family [Filomicrobium insigne]